MDEIVLALEAGASDEQLAEARDFHRWAQMRWDFVSLEISTGFHSPQEAARILAGSFDMARRSKSSATAVLNELDGGITTSYAP